MELSDQNESLDFVSEILDCEWDMFRRVRSAYPVGCQRAPQTFRKVRGSIFELWTKGMLESYLSDLREAKKAGRNLLTEKYARMDNLIPQSNFHPLIEKIVSIEGAWQTEVKRNYPHLYVYVCRDDDPTGDGRNFAVYLRSELETYGSKTIELYHQFLKQALDAGENLTLKMLEKLVLKGGFKDLDQAERYFADRLSRGASQ